MDYLMQFADYSIDNSIESFVESLDELKILFEQLSPTVSKYFENCFIRTNNSKSISRVQWTDTRGSVQVVVRKQESHVNVSDVDSVRL